MRRFVHRLFSAAPALVLLIAAVYAGIAGRAFAHGAGWNQENAFAVVLSLHYADQTPMLYCEVQVFSPADPKIAYQKGRSDRNGGFAFKPNRPGLWLFTASDSEGHKSTGEVEVSAAQLSAASASTAGDAPLASGGVPAEGGDPVRIVLGISIIANLCLLFLRKRK